MANIERLKHLQEILKNVPEESLDMETWSNECGTSACAVGWSCMDKKFQEQGLSLEKRERSFIGLESVMVPFYKGISGWEAVEDFFDLDSTQSGVLFDMMAYDNGTREVVLNGDDLVTNITPQDVIKRIQIVIDNPDENGDTISELIEEMEQNV